MRHSGKIDAVLRCPTKSGSLTPSHLTLGDEAKPGTRLSTSRTLEVTTPTSDHVRRQRASPSPHSSPKSYPHLHFMSRKTIQQRKHSAGTEPSVGTRPQAEVRWLRVVGRTESLVRTSHMARAPSREHV